MAKMSKSMIRKRLSEASAKIGNVALEVYNNPTGPLTPSDAKNLTACLNSLNKIVNRMK